MDLNEYQKKALLTDKEFELPYYFLQLMRESGEVSDVFIKQEYYKYEENQESMKLELGDVLWFVATIAHKFNLSLDEIANSNIYKLKLRHSKKYNSKEE